MSELRQVSRARKIDGPLTPTYGPPIDHSSAWKVADFTTPADYTIELDATHLRDIGHAVRQLKAAGLGLDDLPERKLAWPTADPGSAAAVPANWIDPSIRDAVAGDPPASPAGVGQHRDPAQHQVRRL